MTNFVITSDEQAFSFIDQYLHDSVDLDAWENIEVSGWPILSIRLTGEKFDQSITPSIMKALIELQSAIYRSVALERYGVPDSRKLSKDERDALELQIRVGKGSSILDIDMQGVIEHLIDKAVPTMEPTTAIIMVLGLGVVWGSSTAFKSYLQHRRDVRSDELKSEKDREQMQSIQFLSTEETKRLELVTQMAHRFHEVDNASRFADDARGELLKSFSHATTAEIGDSTIDSDLASSLAKNARRKSEEVRLDGTYRVLRNDTTDPDAFKVRLRNTANNAQIDAVVQDDSVNDRIKSAIRKAEWDRTPVALRINAKSFEGDIRSAVVIGLVETD